MTRLTRLLRLVWRNDVVWCIVWSVVILGSTVAFVIF